MKANLQVNRKNATETNNHTPVNTSQIIPEIMRTTWPSSPNPPFSFAFRSGGGRGTLLWILIRCRPARRLPARHTAHSYFRCPSVPIFCLLGIYYFFVSHFFACAHVTFSVFIFISFLFLFIYQTFAWRRRNNLWHRLISTNVGWGLGAVVVRIISGIIWNMIPM